MKRSPQYLPSKGVTLTRKAARHACPAAAKCFAITSFAGLRAERPAGYAQGQETGVEWHQRSAKWCVENAPLCVLIVTDKSHVARNLGAMIGSRLVVHHGSQY